MSIMIEIQLNPLTPVADLVLFLSFFKHDFTHELCYRRFFASPKRLDLGGRSIYYAKKNIFHHPYNFY